MSAVKRGMRVRVEADDTHFGKVLRIIKGEAEIRWDSGQISRIDVLDCHPEPTHD